MNPAASRTCGQICRTCPVQARLPTECIESPRVACYGEDRHQRRSFPNSRDRPHRISKSRHVASACLKNGAVGIVMAERPVPPSSQRGCPTILCPPMKEVQYSTEDVDVVESTGPVLAQACSITAAIQHHACSALQGTQALGRGVSLVTAEVGARPAGAGGTR